MSLGDGSHAPNPLCAVPVPQAGPYYEAYETPSAKIARLESELGSARLEIERLRTRLSDYEKDRKPDTPKVQSRYWTPHEHQRFLEALGKFGPKDVRAIANYVGSRNATQVRTHAQKYFLRMARERKNGSALQSARKRSMSESDLARVGRSVRTPPGSPPRDNANAHDGKSERDEISEDGRKELKRDRSPISQNDVSMDGHRDYRTSRDENRSGGGGFRTMRVASTSALAALEAAAGGSRSTSPRPSRRSALDGDEGDGDDDMGMDEDISKRFEDEREHGNGFADEERSAMDVSERNEEGSPRSSGSTRTAYKNGQGRRSVTFVSSGKPPTLERAGASGINLDTAGINLLSLVASERKLEAESGPRGL